MKRMSMLLFITILFAACAFASGPKQTGAQSPAYDSLVVMPTPILSPAPAYPEHARKKSIQGTVWLQVKVSAEGKVKNARVMKNSTKSSELEDAALAAVKKWEFKPATKNDKPVEVTVTIPFQFKLDGDKPKGK